MANERELKLKITGDSSAAEKAVKRLETALAKAQAELEKAAVDAAKADDKIEDVGDAAEKAADKVDDLGDEAKGTGDELSGIGGRVGDLLSDQLGVAGDAAEKLGIDLEKVGPAGQAAAAGVGAAVALVASGVQEFRQLTGEVKQYQAAARVSAEEGSRLNAVFKQFGVEADDGIDVLKTLAEEAGDAPEKFKQFNVEIARTSTGAVDMTATLANVADRFSQMRDPAQRAAMGAALFGDAWLRIAPILDRGGANLRQMLSAVDNSAIVTEKGIRQAEEYDRSLAQLSQQFKKVQIEVGREALPELIESMQNLTATLNAVNDAADKVGGIGRLKNVFDTVTSPIEQARRATDHIADVWRRTTADGDELSTMVTDVAVKFGELAVKAAPAGAATQALADAEKAAAAEAAELQRRQDDMARSSRDAMSAIDAQRDSLQELTSVIFSMAGTDLAVEQANVALGESMDRLVEKQTAVTDAVNQYGQDSPQATTAVRDYEKGLLDTRGAADRLAQAQVEQARQQATAAGQTLTDAEAIAIYKGSIENTRDATNDPALWSGLDTMASKIGANADAAAAARDRINEATEAAANLAAQAFGERAASIARGIIARSPSAGFSQQRSDGAQTASVTNNVTVQAQTNANPWDIAAQVDWALRTGGR